MPTCVLCQSHESIENSHIVPNLIIRRLKDDSPLNNLRFSDEPNLPRQDGWKLPLLCLDCEQYFSRLENSFCQSIYDPLLAGQLSSPVADESLYLFAVSLHFRHLHFLRSQYEGNCLPILDIMISVLRDILLSGAYSPRPAYFHMQFLDYIVTRNEMFPPGINHYFFHSIDGAVFDYHFSPADIGAILSNKIPKTAPHDSPTMWVAYVKIPSIIFVMIFSEEAQLLSLWDDFRIHIGRSINMDFASSPLYELISESCVQKASMIQENYNKMSERQLHKVTTAIASNPNPQDFTAHKAWEADMTLLKLWSR